MDRRAFLTGSVALLAAPLGVEAPAALAAKKVEPKFP